MDKCSINAGQNINAAAIAFAGAVSKDLSADEIALLAAFFTVVGDSLATIAAAAAVLSD